MSLDANKALVRRFFEEVFNQGRLEVCDEIFAPNFGGRGLASHGASGLAGARHAALAFRAAFPDIHFTVDDLIAEGHKVVVHVTFRGTHRGPFLGVPATGRSVVVSGVELAVIEQGRIIEEAWHYLDEVGLLRQLGAL